MRQKQDKFLIVTLPIPAACADMKEKELLSNWSSLEEQYKADAIFKKIKVFHSAIRKQRPSKSQGSKSSRRVSSSPDNEQCLSSTTLLVMALIALLVGWLYY
ncbi:Scs22p [Saccharomyces cerevisiae x Saccharomyces kudriavzevii VIN7]|uniref:Scs22p n=1 Tax=Saccharomyces cerevisiae x Saccharomyces kudriavzevii (strain VIN7) TaxID=1095631 RepID=H0GQY8_SACCK|nr:Scs22p [Saccharomyces cerevisiae x Saccharomyces kudriavzevii VIN7]